MREEKRREKQRERMRMPTVTTRTTMTGMVTMCGERRESLLHGAPLFLIDKYC